MTARTSWQEIDPASGGSVPRIRETVIVKRARHRLRVRAARPDARTPAKPGPVIRALPRPQRRIAKRSAVYSPVPQRKRETYTASFPRTILRLIAWLYPVGYFAFYLVVDFLRGRNTALRRAERVRMALQQMGGTFVKFGQQMSTRLDLLPPEWCYELSRLLDDSEPFAFERAVKAVERSTGRPLGETFSAFDPQPLGSGSVACVYHATLATGEDVAVKVRRPGITQLFAADLNALDLLCRVAELLTIIRPGFTEAMRGELRTMFFEELNFRSEARYQDLFRRQARLDHQHYVTAPKVYFEHSGTEVIVSEYVTGVWLGDLISAKEFGDTAALEEYRLQNITPKEVARRLIRTRHWSTYENLFYHGDPHPSNVVVRPDNKLVLIDFGACGPTSHRIRRQQLELFRRQAARDVDGMVEVFNNMLAPLPHLDLNAFSKAGEAQVWQWMYGFESKHSEWWEHTSANMWIRLFEATREFGIPVNIETIRLMRSSLLYDTVAARLYDHIDMQKEFVKYEREARRRAVVRLVDRFQEIWSPGKIALEAERYVDIVSRLIYKVQQFVDEPTAPFLAAISKASFVAAAALRLVLIASTMTAFGALVVALRNQYRGVPADAMHNVTSVFGWYGYWILMTLVLVRFYRDVQFKLNDIDRQNQSRFGDKDPLN